MKYKSLISTYNQSIWIWQSQSINVYKIEPKHPLVVIRQYHLIMIWKDWTYCITLVETVQQKYNDSLSTQVLYKLCYIVQSLNVHCSTIYTPVLHCSTSCNSWFNRSQPGHMFPSKWCRFSNLTSSMNIFWHYQHITAQFYTTAWSSVLVINNCSPFSSFKFGTCDPHVLCLAK